jgi:hypothetical protein
MLTKKEQWKELHKALDKFQSEDWHKSVKVNVNFSQAGGDENTLQLYIEGLGLCYNKKRGWCWDIFLNKDGTWTIG